MMENDIGWKHKPKSHSSVLERLHTHAVSHKHNHVPGEWNFE